MNSDLEQKIKSLTSGEHRHEMKQIGSLYDVLGVIDTKAIGLLTVNSIVFAILAAFFFSDRFDEEPLYMLSSMLGIAVLLMLLVSSLLYLNVLAISWRILGKVRKPVDETESRPVSMTLGVKSASFLE